MPKRTANTVRFICKVQEIRTRVLSKLPLCFLSPLKVKIYVWKIEKNADFLYYHLCSLWGKDQDLLRVSIFFFLAMLTFFVFKFTFDPILAIALLWENSLEVSLAVELKYHASCININWYFIWCLIQNG